MVDQQKTLNFISGQNDCQKFSPSQISNMLQAGFEPALNLSSGFVEGSCAVMITTKARCHKKTKLKQFKEF